MSSRYRRVRPGLWREPAYVGLDQVARLVVLYVLSGPQSTAIGLGPFSIGAAAEDLDLSPAEVRAALGAACGAMGWRYDEAARVLWMPDHWRTNQPENPSVLRGLLKVVAEIPPCALREAFCAHDGDLSPALRLTFREVLGTRTDDGSRDVSQQVSPHVTAEVSPEVTDTSGTPVPTKEQSQQQKQQQETAARANDPLPPWWSGQQVGRGTLAAADVESFARHVAALERPLGLVPLEFARWLDAQLAAWRARRDDARRAAAAVAATDARLDRQAAERARIERELAEYDIERDGPLPFAGGGRSAH